jgi:hypothetical protein
VVRSLCNILSDERMGLSFRIVTGPRQRSHFYCLRLETPPTWRARYPYLYSPGTRWPSYTPRHWVPFSSPPTIRRATIEIFDPASTRDSTTLDYCFLLFKRPSLSLYNPSARNPRKTPSSVVKGVCLQFRCLAIGVLLLSRARMLRECAYCVVA